jgi:aminopeptidase-like protein
MLADELPVMTFEIPSGTPVFDWTVPQEWNINEAWIKGPDGNKIVDFADHNLHILNYSTPIHKKMPLHDLEPQLFTIPDQPDLIPYRTSYYNKNWGFCMRHNTYSELKDGEYEVYIDSDLSDGALTYGEVFVPGNRVDEVLISTHICHPSLCNDNLSGISVAVEAAKYLFECKNNELSYRFLFIPGTIGSITWLSENEEKLSRIRYGLVLSCLGDSGSLTFKKSRSGDREIDKIGSLIMNSREDEGASVREFLPYGYDERQYCSPGINLPMGCLTRTPFGEFPEYHTSADNPGFMREESLEDSLQALKGFITCFEGNQTYVNKKPKCEPNLGKRGLYDSTGGRARTSESRMALLWILNQADGSHSLVDIARKSGIDFDIVRKAAEDLRGAGLLEERPENDKRSI